MSTKNNSNKAAAGNVATANAKTTTGNAEPKATATTANATAAAGTATAATANKAAAGTAAAGSANPNKLTIECTKVNNKQKGGGHSFDNLGAQNAASSGMGRGVMPIAKYSNCGASRSSGMGAGVQHGGHIGVQLAPANVENSSVLVSNPPAVNNSMRPGYGYTSGQDNQLFAGSGYPKSSSYNSNSCAQSGGRKRKSQKRKSHKRKSLKRKSHKRKSHKHKSLKHKSHKHKSHKRKSHKRNKKHRKKRTKSRSKHNTLHKQKGGYSQYQSNVPLSPSYQQPNPGPMPWATGPGSFTRQVNCPNNYNHFAKK